MKVAKAEERVQHSRCKIINSLHLGAILLGQPGGRRYKTILMQVGNVLYKAFSKESSFDNLGLLRKLIIVYSKCGGSYYLRKVWSVLLEAQQLEAMGFSTDNAAADQKHYSSARPMGSSSSSSGPAPPSFPRSYQVPPF